jgi:hypothetical protein
MCWSGEASFVMATIGLVGAAYEVKKTRRTSPNGTGSNWKVDGWTGKYSLRALTLAYFSLMELLQGFNYMVLSHPGPLNSLCAFLGYVHISFQPIFSSWFMLSFLPKARRMKHFKWVTCVSVVAILFMLAHLIKHPSLPGCFSNDCVPKKSMSNILHSKDWWGRNSIGCSQTHFRSYVGDWHIAWQWLLNGCSWLKTTYIFVSFFLPIFYGAYRVMLYTLIFGPVLAYFLTGNPDEWAAIWCLLSIAFLSGVKIPWLERLLTVKK